MFTKVKTKPGHHRGWGGGYEATPMIPWAQRKQKLLDKFSEGHHSYSKPTRMRPFEKQYYKDIYRLMDEGLIKLVNGGSRNWIRLVNPPVKEEPTPPPQPYSKRKQAIEEFNKINDL